jgi:hypothetical protein
MFFFPASPPPPPPVSQCIYDIANAKRFFVYKNVFPACSRTGRRYKKSTRIPECFLLLSTLLLFLSSWNNAHIILSGRRLSGWRVFGTLYKQCLITAECWFFPPGRLYKQHVFYKPFTIARAPVVGRDRR